MFYKIGKETDGDDALVCVHLRDWYPVFARKVRENFGVELEIIQAKGKGSKSGGTHADGTALDLRTYKFTTKTVLGIVALAREMGARGTWYRTKAQGFDPHIHLVLACPCESAADYQTTAVDKGFNGLGNGYKGKDTHPAPSQKRNYKEGIEWATADDAPQEEDDMTPEQDALLRQINLAVCDRKNKEATAADAARHVWKTTEVPRNGKRVAAIQELADAKTGIIALQAQVAALTAAVAAIGNGKGIDAAAIQKVVSDAVAKALATASVTVDLGE